MAFLSITVETEKQFRKIQTIKNLFYINIIISSNPLIYPFLFSIKKVCCIHLTIIFINVAEFNYLLDFE